MTAATIEERLAVAEQRITALEAQRAELATTADVERAIERAINTFTWRLIASLIALAGVIVTAMAAAAFVVVNAINIAMAGS